MESCSACDRTGILEVSEYCPSCMGTGVISSPCEICGGSGMADDVTCPSCMGMGALDSACESCAGSGTLVHTEICNNCNGLGEWEVSEICPNCNGAGYLDTDSTGPDTSGGTILGLEEGVVLSMAPYLAEYTMSEILGVLGVCMAFFIGAIAVDKGVRWLAQMLRQA